MRVRKILFGDEARAKIIEGIKLVADTVRHTLGPQSRTTLVSKLNQPVRIFNDGTAIADEVDTVEPFVRAGVKTAQEAAKRTNDRAGDGTTTTALLIHALVTEGNRRIIAGESPRKIKEELDDARDVVIQKLREATRPVETIEQIRQVATIAANNDVEAGNVIAEIAEKVGKSANIMVEKSNDAHLRVEAVKGIWFEKGFLAPAFVNTREFKAVLEDALIVVTDKRLVWANDIQLFFEKCAEAKLDKIVLIADDVEGEALYSLCSTNKAALTENQGMHVLAIAAPEFGETRLEILDDICTMTGATLVSDRNGLSFQTVDPAKVVGRADKVVSDSRSTTILGGKGDAEAVTQRISALRDQISQLPVTDKIIHDKLEKRLMNLESGVGIIYAGGPTDLESKERYTRMEDAILAVRAAVKHGVVPGGGLMYLWLGVQTKSKILQAALRSVPYQLALNAGQNPEAIIGELQGHFDNPLPTYGWDALNNRFGNLFEFGILDATQVVAVAIGNAVSTAAALLTMEAAIVEEIVEGQDELTPRERMRKR